MPDVHLYVAGFPCQCYSAQGSRGGARDSRSGVFHDIVRFIASSTPRCFILENVPELCANRKYRFTWATMRLALARVAGGRYSTVWRVLKSSEHGVPQARSRLFIVGIDRSKQVHAFQWPQPLQHTPAVRTIYDRDATPRLTTLENHPRRGTVYFKNWAKCLHMIILEKRKHPLREDFILNVGGSKPHFMHGVCPTLTRARCGSDGYWVTSLGRSFTLSEYCRLQAYPPTRIWNRSGMSDRAIRLMIGNGMPVNVVERILFKLLPCVGLVTERHLNARWESAADAAASLEAMCVP